MLRGLRMRKLVTNRWVHVYPSLVSRGEVEGGTGLLELLFVCSYLGQELDGQGAPIKAEWATSHD